jgi:hypothetical protein
MIHRDPPDIELHIEELVLHGAAPGQRHAIADQLAAALETALADGGLGAWATDGAAIAHLTARLPAATSAPNPAPGVPIGRAIASTLR